ncbi:MAG: ComEC/Rec2 family competence protein [Treponema sp.]|jgi:competence protein ComEC|nr:ComEC/Rec2 family competence protein [Treponema sp.]
MNRTQWTPVLSASCGAAAGFYCLAALFRSGLIGINALLALVLVPAALLCFFRSVVSVPRVWVNGLPALVRRMSIHSVAFAAGLAAGMGAGTAAVPPVRLGVPDSALRAVSGVLLDDPRVISGGRVMAALALRESLGRIPGGSGDVRVSAAGEILVFFPAETAGRIREFGRGTVVLAEGALQKSGAGRGGTYSPYLFSADSAHVVTAAPVFERFRTGVRLGLIQRFDRAAPGSDASWGGLALALLLGIRDSLDSGLAAQYRDAGCSYILALSGMHLAVLAGLISLLLKRALGMRTAAAAGAVIIVLYCFITGPLPSLYRAALMYLLGVVAVLGMLKREPLSLLGMAFLIQIMAAPQSGLSLSFILSYLALAGILISGESLAGIFRGVIPHALLQSLSASLGAFLATAGVSAFFFGVLHPAGIIAGLALVPLTTVFMIGSLFWLGLDCIAPAVSGLAGRPLSLLYGLMEKIVSVAARVPGIRMNPHMALWLSLSLIAVIAWSGWYSRIARGRVDSFDQ